MGLSNVEDILQAGLDGTDIPRPESRIAELLKEWIEQGGNIDDILVAGTNITLTKNADGTITIAASGEVSSEDTVARAEIAAIKDGETLDSFGDVETELATKANADNVYKLALSYADLLPANTDLDNVKTVGCYYVLAAATVSTITNRPANGGAFRLTVELGAGIIRSRQIYQEFNSYDKYIRYETSSAEWANWKKVECALSTKQDTISDLSTIRSGAALGATAVQPETGKGLSTNDYTTAEKTKLAGIAEGAEVNEIEGIKVNNTTINPDANKVVNITVPTSAADVSALPDTTKYAAALSLTINSSTFVMTGQLKDQNGDNLGTAQTIDLPLESVVVNGSYDSQTKKVVLTLQNGNTIEFSVADLVSGLQTELSASNKLNPAYIDYDSTHAAITEAQREQIETNKNNILLLEQMNGTKNIVDYRNANTSLFPSSTTGATISRSADEWNINGTTNASGTLLVNIYINPDATNIFPVGEYVAQIYPTNDDIRLNIVVDNDIISNGLNPVSFTITNATTRSWARLNLGNNKTFNNFKFKLMVVPKAIWDAGFTDYQPYAMTNAEITAWILSQS